MSLSVFLELILKLFRPKSKKKPDNRPDSPIIPIPSNKDAKPTPIPEEPTMELEVLRYSSQNESTLGAMFDVTNGRKFLCYTLEDEFRTQKVYEKTRIPAGRYEVTLRTEGGFHQRYGDKFGSMHKGMLWVRNIPNFEYVLIHIGNKDDDTAGCLLVGNTSTQNVTEDGFVGSSTAAYKRIYPPIAAALEKGESVYITYIDYDSVS